MEKQSETNRVRLNFSQTAKGAIQIDCTVEFPTVEECDEAMRELFDRARAIISDKGLTEAGAV